MQNSYHIIYGIHSVEHALKIRSNQCLEIAVLSDSNNRLKHIINMAKNANVKIYSMNKAKLSDYCCSNNHQGVAAKMKQVLPVMTEDELLTLAEMRQLSTLLILDGVQDPHNLGAIIRTADAAGVQAVVVPQDNSVKVTAAVMKVASGAAETVPVVPIKNLARFMKQLQAAGIWIVGATGGVEKSIYEVDLTNVQALVVGAEGKGLRQLTAKSCDHLVYIPMYGKVESLNVSVATGICLYEMIRKRK